MQQISPRDSSGAPMLMPRGQTWTSLVLVIAMAMFVSCTRDVVGTDAPVAGLDTLAITPQLARGLTSAGRFVLSGPMAGSDELPENVVLELTRFGGHFTLWGTGVFDARHQTQVPTGVS